MTAGRQTASYRRSLAKLAQLDIECLIPGHGELVRGEKAIKKNFQLIIGEFFA